jgi:hypothetical protein
MIIFLGKVIDYGLNNPGKVLVLFMSEIILQSEFLDGGLNNLMGPYPLSTLLHHTANETSKSALKIFS